MKIIDRLENWNKPVLVLLSLFLILALGLIDYSTGYEYSFSLFYLLPIALVGWFVDRWFGIYASFISAIVWFLADVFSGNQYAAPAIFFWNTAIRLGFFIIVTLLLAALRSSLEREEDLSRTDNLTGAFNSGYFSDLLQAEINRFQRYKHPFTLAYLDLDNFKTVNDQQGHTVGDKVLKTIVTHIRTIIRKSDLVARLGGDEFAILLPETGHLASKAALSKIEKSLMKEMRKFNWPVTFSIGVITFLECSQNANDLIKMSDDLMYTVKNNGKNAIVYSVHSG
jgi:diguanylate cyclase (GGDEF)-like protein